MAVLLRGGGGVKGLPLRKRRTKFGTFFSFVIKFRLPLSSRGWEGGGGGLNGNAIKTLPPLRTFFCCFPNTTETNYWLLHLEFTDKAMD